MSEGIKYIPFMLSDTRYFHLHSTSSGIDKIKLDFNSFPKTFPYITRTEKNNGCITFIGKQEKSTDKGNTITIGLDTQTVFYQPTDFYTGQNVQILESQFMTKNIALYLIPLIKKQLKLLNWGGNGATLNRLRAKKILLPVNEQLEPDWEYMDDFVETNIKPFQNLCHNSLLTSSLLDLNSVKWADFSISDLFEVHRGNAGAKKELKQGNIPLISARKRFNGFDSFVEVAEDKIHSNSISVNNNGDGGAGLSFFHNYTYAATQDVTILKEKQSLSKNSKLFISVCINKQANKFGHGNKLTSKRLLNQKILLPITDAGNINFSFMDLYISTIYKS